MEHTEEGFSGQALGSPVTQGASPIGMAWAVQSRVIRTPQIFSNRKKNDHRNPISYYG